MTDGIKFDPEADSMYLIPRDEGGDPPKMQYFRSAEDSPWDGFQKSLNVPDEFPEHAPKAGITRWFEPNQETVTGPDGKKRILVGGVDPFDCSKMNMGLIDEMGFWGNVGVQCRTEEDAIAFEKLLKSRRPGKISWAVFPEKKKVIRHKSRCRKVFSKHKAPVSAAGKPTVEITLTKDSFFKP